MTARAWAAAACLAIAACKPDEPGRAPCSEIAAVYATSVSVLGQHRSSRTVVIDTNTAPLPPTSTESVSSELLNRFHTAQEASPLPRCSGALSSSFRCLDPEALDAAFAGVRADEAWAKFEQQYGIEGYWTLSAVGFDRHRREALCLVGYLCGPRCGNGYLLHLRKREGAWVVVGSHVVWAS